MIRYWSAYLFASHPDWELTEVKDDAVHLGQPQAAPNTMPGMQEVLK